MADKNINIFFQKTIFHKKFIKKNIKIKIKKHEKTKTKKNFLNQIKKIIKLNCFKFQ